MAQVRAGGGYVLDSEGSGDMEPGAGAALRLELPLGRFVTLGPMFQFVSLKDAGSSNRYELLGAGLRLGMRRVFELGFGGIEISLSAPFGYTALLYHLDTGTTTDRGVHTGLLAGGKLFLGRRMALLLEVGFMRDFIFAPEAGRRSYVQTQAAVNLGISIGFR
ncbi:MAG: hypothetical protein JJ863_07445 [Deltaproteobacteria bacterium]|nr:hypothetical protein [Deltaproteobacteria bacterium]